MKNTKTQVIVELEGDKNIDESIYRWIKNKNFTFLKNNIKSDNVIAFSTTDKIDFLKEIDYAKRTKDMLEIVEYLKFLVDNGQHFWINKNPKSLDYGNVDFGNDSDYKQFIDKNKQ